MKGLNRDSGLHFQGDNEFATFTKLVKRKVVRAILSATKKKGRTNDMGKYSTKPATGVQKIETLGGEYALKWNVFTRLGDDGTIRRLFPPDIGGQMTMPIT